MRRSLNAFRTIAPESFGGIPKYQDFVDRQVKVSLIVFFAKILEPKECKKALIVAGLTMKSAEKIALNAVRKQDDKVLVSDIPSAKKAAHISIVNSIILEEVCFPKMAVDGSDRVTLSA
ncbi:MAG: hypothetical protein KAQ63_01910 [Candidatus Moranbacteria bacterium]|nr:hypothetical protein [Candidatus Moranbacteria bacterium]